MVGLHEAPHAKLLSPLERRDVRVVEGARLESVCRGNSTEGSNPSLSASLRLTCATRTATAGLRPLHCADSQTVRRLSRRARRESLSRANASSRVAPKAALLQSFTPRVNTSTRPVPFAGNAVRPSTVRCPPPRPHRPHPPSPGRPPAPGAPDDGRFRTPSPAKTVRQTP